MQGHSLTERGRRGEVLPGRVVASRAAVAAAASGKASRRGAAPDRRPGDARGDRVRAGVRVLLAKTTRVVPGALAYRAPPVRRVGGRRRNDRPAPGPARRARRRRADRLVAGEYRQHARPRPQKGNLTGPSPVDRGKPGSKDRKSTRLNSSHVEISYAVFCLKKK